MGIQLIVKPVAPMILDASIHRNDGVPLAMADEDHRVFLPNRQLLVIDTVTGEIKTVKRR